MKAFIEPQRYGKPKFFHHSYYGRNSRHITDIYDYTADLIILLERSDKKIILHPANSEMKPMHYHASQVQIQGVLVGQMRSYH